MWLCVFSIKNKLNVSLVFFPGNPGGKAGVFCLGNPDRREDLVPQEIQVKRGGGGVDFFWNNPISLKSHQIAQFTKNGILTLKKFHKFLQNTCISVSNTLSGKIWHMHGVSRWFDVEKCLENLLQPLILLTIEIQGVSWMSRDWMMLVVLKFRQSLPLLRPSTTWWPKQCLFWWQNVAKLPKP